MRTGEAGLARESSRVRVGSSAYLGARQREYIASSQRHVGVPSPAGSSRPCRSGHDNVFFRLIGKRLSRVLFAALLGVFAGSEAVFAQGVFDRPRPDYDPIGVPAGGFRIFPTLDVGLFQDDNVYRTQTNTREDIFVEVAPAIAVRSQWAVHMLNIAANLQRYVYRNLSSESQTNWFAGGDGRLDILRGIYFTGAGDYAELHEPRTSPDLPGFAAKPTEYANPHGQGALTYHPFRVGIEAGGIFDRFQYQDTPLVGGTFLHNKDRDREIYQAYAKLSYDFSPGYAVFVRGTYDQWKYDLKADRTGVDRDSDGEHFDAGLSLQVTQLVRGEIFGGYLDQHYKAPLINISGPGYGSTLDWYPLEVLTIHLIASRTQNATTITGASATDDQHVGVGLDYELARDFLVQTTAGYTHSAFSGTTRIDKYSDAGVGLTWLVNRLISVSGRYAYSRRDSSLAGQNFADNVFSIRIGFHP